MEKNDLFYRSYGLDRSALDEENRTIPITFSTETPVRRWGWDEYLLHGNENVKLSRLKNMGAALLNHNPNMIVGSIQGVRLENREGKAVIRFDDDEDGNKAMGKVRSGSLKGVSVGYAVWTFHEVGRDEKYELPTKKKIKGPAMVATLWEPYENSLTPIPADPNSKVGRMLTRSLDGIEITRTKEKPKMEKKEVQAMIDESLGKLKFATKEDIPTAESIAESVRSIIAEEAKPKMRISTETYQDLLGRAGAVSIELKAQVADMAVDGKTETEILRAITDAHNNPDAHDRNGLEDGTGLKNKNKGFGTIRSFKEIDDDQFFSGLSTPNAFPIQ